MHLRSRLRAATARPVVCPRDGEPRPAVLPRGACFQRRTQAAPSLTVLCFLGPGVDLPQKRLVTPLCRPLAVTVSLRCVFAHAPDPSLLAFCFSAAAASPSPPHSQPSGLRQHLLSTAVFPVFPLVPGPACAAEASILSGRASSVEDCVVCRRPRSSLPSLCLLRLPHPWPLSHHEVVAGESLEPKEECQ